LFSTATAIVILQLTLVGFMQQKRSGWASKALCS